MVVLEEVKVFNRVILTCLANWSFLVDKLVLQVMHVHSSACMFVRNLQVYVHKRNFSSRKIQRNR